MTLEAEIDPVKYGVLWQKVQDMTKKLDKMEVQVEQLLELANKSQGGFWFGMTVMSAVSGFIGFILSHYRDHP